MTAWALERAHLDVRHALGRSLHELHALAPRKQRVLLLPFGHGHDDAVEEVGRPLHHVEVSERDGIEAAGVDRDSHFCLLRIDTQLSP
jgi:hypothetical protein